MIKILQWLLGIMAAIVVGAALCVVAFGAREYDTTIFFGDVFVGEFGPLTNVNLVVTNNANGTYTNGTVTNFYRVSAVKIGKGRVPLTETNVVFTGTTNFPGGSNTVVITWRRYPGAASNVVERSFDAGVTYTNYSFLRASVTNFTDFGTNVFDFTNVFTNVFSPIPTITVPWVPATNPTLSQADVFTDSNNVYDVTTTQFMDQASASNLVVGDGAATGQFSAAVGQNVDVSGDFAFGAGRNLNVRGTQSAAMGKDNSTFGVSAFAGGSFSIASNSFALAFGLSTLATGASSVAVGDSTTAGADAANAEGKDTTASGRYAHAEGSNTTASGEAAHAEGEGVTSSGLASHAEGRNTVASNTGAHAEGGSTTAGGPNSHAEGSTTIASGDAAHAEGQGTTASGDNSHSQGDNTTASGLRSFAAGRNATAGNDDSIVFSDGTVISSTDSNQVTMYYTNGYRLLGAPTEMGADPVNPPDAATKRYVDAATNNLAFGLTMGRITNISVTTVATNVLAVVQGIGLETNVAFIRLFGHGGNIDPGSTNNAESVTTLFAGTTNPSASPGLQHFEHILGSAALNFSLATSTNVITVRLSSGESAIVNVLYEIRGDYTKVIELQ